MYMCVSGIDVTAFYTFSVRLWNGSDNVVFLFLFLFHTFFDVTTSNVFY